MITIYFIVVGILFTSGILLIIFLLIDSCHLAIRFIVIFIREYMSMEKDNEIWLPMVYLSDSCLEGSEEKELV